MLKPITSILVVFALCLVGSCKVNQTKNGLKNGLWITKDGNGEEGYKSRGRYKKDKEKGVWKYFYNDTLYQKDRYSGNNARVRFYHPNKKIRASGQTQMEYTGKLAHWYYNGNWKYFDSQGDLIKVITYKKGAPVSEYSNQIERKQK